MNDFFDIKAILNSEILIVIILIFGLLIFASLLIYILDKTKPNLDTSELQSRTKSWWVMASIFLLATLFNTKISFLALAFLSFLAFREMYSILQLRQSDRRAIFWGLLAIPIQYHLAYIGWYGAFIIFIPVVMFMIIPMRLVISGDTKGIIKSMATLQWTLMLTVFGISHMAYLISLPSLEGFEVGGRGLLLYLVFLTEINDILQFTWGKLFGKHKVVPRISPNKTWEGLIGGILCTTIIGYFLAFLTPLTNIQSLFVSFVIAIAGFIGDLVMSAIKRDIGVKDMGTTIPGHGGVLDRIDSLSYTSLAFFHLIFYIAY